MQRSGKEQSQRILDQFTRQAKPFADAAAHSAEDTLRLLVETMEVNREDDALDVACGPGIVACAMAEIARSVHGIDLTPAMIEQARKRQIEKGLSNVAWRIGDGAELPYPEDSFTLVATRYSFHHLIDPGAVLREMTRVCRPGGRVAVIDVTPEAAKTPAYDETEILRDPSHTHALSFDELKTFGDAQGLLPRRTAFYRLEIALETLLAGSFPPEGNADRIRRMAREDIGRNRLSLGVFDRDGEVYYSFPTTAMVWIKPGK